MLMAIKAAEIAQDRWNFLMAILDIDLSQFCIMLYAFFFLFPYAIFQLLFITLLLWAMALVGATFSVIEVIPSWIFLRN